jgi:hypothetical protein
LIQRAFLRDGGCWVELADGRCLCLKRSDRIMYWGIVAVAVLDGSIKEAPR